MDGRFLDVLPNEGRFTSSLVSFGLISSNSSESSVVLFCDKGETKLYCWYGCFGGGLLEVDMSFVMSDILPVCNSDVRGTAINCAVVDVRFDMIRVAQEDNAVMLHFAGVSFLSLDEIDSPNRGPWCGRESPHFVLTQNRQTNSSC